MQYKCSLGLGLVSPVQDLDEEHFETILSSLERTEQARLNKVMFLCFVSLSGLGRV